MTEKINNRNTINKCRLKQEPNEMRFNYLSSISSFQHKPKYITSLVLATIIHKSLSTREITSTHKLISHQKFKHHHAEQAHNNISHIMNPKTTFCALISDQIKNTIRTNCKPLIYDVGQLWKPRYCLIAVIIENTTSYSTQFFNSHTTQRRNINNSPQWKRFEINNTCMEK